MSEQLAQGRVVLIVSFDRRSGVRRLECLFEQTNLSRDARHETVEHFHVVHGFLDDFLVGRRAVKAPLAMRVVVAECQEFFVTLLERLELRKPLIDGELSHGSTFIRREFS